MTGGVKTIQGCWKTCQRLVDWNVEMLTHLLKQITASPINAVESRSERKRLPKLESELGASATVLDEVTEIITLPGFDSSTKDHVDPAGIDIGPEVTKQLCEYVSFVAASYRKNPFHNFEVSTQILVITLDLLSTKIQLTGRALLFWL
jgi:hypothetical protein